MSTQIEQTVITDSSIVTSCSTFKPEIEKENVLDLIPSENSVQKDVVIVVIDQEEEDKKKEMVKEFISGGFHGNSAITTNDDTSSVLMVEKKKKEEDSGEPISQLENGVKKNQESEELVSKDSTELLSSVKDSSAKEEVCQVNSLPPSMSQYENVVVKMNSGTSSRICKQEEVFQVQDVITGDEHIILVVETTQDGFVETKSNSSSQNLVEMSNWDHFLDKKTTNQEMMIGSGDTNWWGKWGEFSASGSSSNGMGPKIGSTRIVYGNGCARKELMGSVALGKRRSGICTGNVKQRGGKCSRRNFTEINLKKEVLSVFAEARNVFLQKKLDGIKQSYSREEMEALRFENSHQQRQIWREIYTGLGPVVALELNSLAEARQNGNGITNQQQLQHHHQPQMHHQHPPQHQQHQQYPLQSLQHHQHPQQSRQHHQHPQQQQQHHQHPKKPPQHHHHHNHHQHQQAGLNKENAPPQHHHHHNHHQHQQAGVNKENASILGDATAMGRPIHLRINMRNARANCYVQHKPVYNCLTH